MKTLFKKTFVIGLILLGTFIVTTLIARPTPVSAAEGFAGSCRDFLGLTSWDCGVDISDEKSLKTDIWTIVANIATDITVAAAYLVLGYVIYGGYLYTFSGGDPSKVAIGKKALYQAFLGLAIVMSAYVIMSSIRFALLGDNGTFGDCLSIDQDTGAITKGSGCVKASDVIQNAIQWVIAIAGIISAIFVVYGGISYTTSAGEPSKLQKAKQMITYALIGLAIVALAEIITAFVTNMIRNSTSTNTSLINNTTISKEVSYHEKNS